MVSYNTLCYMHSISLDVDTLLLKKVVDEIMVEFLMCLVQSVLCVGRLQQTFKHEENLTTGCVFIIPNHCIAFSPPYFASDTEKAINHSA